MLPESDFVPVAPPKFRKRRASAPAAAGVNQVLGVAHGATGELIVVTVRGTVTGFGGMQDVLAVGDGVEGHEPIEADFTNLPQIVFTFGADVSAMTEWLIPDPAARVGAYRGREPDDWSSPASPPPQGP